jgi:elongation factor Ts
MQVAAMSPLFVAPEDVSEEALEAEREVFRSQFADKPEQVRERIVEGKLEAYYAQVCLLKQEYIRDDKRRVEDVVKDAIAKLGENIQVRRFLRLELGGDAQ